MSDKLKITEIYSSFFGWLIIMSEKLKITELYAYIAENEEGEGVCGFWDADMDVFLPMVGADVARVKSIRDKAKIISRETGKKITLCRFSMREEIEVIDERH